MTLVLTNIPSIMRHHGWANGARLMEIWFSRPVAVKPAYGPPVTDTLRMDAWALTFPRVRSVYDTLVRDRVWANDAARREIQRMLQRRGLFDQRDRDFGRVHLPVETLDPDYVNFRVVESGLQSGLDDVFAALGNFVLRVVVGGSVRPVGPAGRSGRYRIEIDTVGVYIRDSYDFEGDQPLGYWDDADNSVSMLNPLSGDAVSNASFRDWRSRHQRGGDFLVYSAVKWTTLLRPDAFEVTV